MGSAVTSWRREESSLFLYLLRVAKISQHKPEAKLSDSRQEYRKHGHQHPFGVKSLLT